MLSQKTMATEGFFNSTNEFWYSFGNYVIKKKKYFRFSKKLYFSYVCLKLEDQAKPWAPHNVCCICVAELSSFYVKTLFSFLYMNGLKRA